MTTASHSLISSWGKTRKPPPYLPHCSYIAGAYPNTPVSRAAVNTQRNAQARVHERNGLRGFHGSLRRQAILMPAMSPLMNEGTITRWKKREGEAFAAGDVLLQIESDIAMIDVEANSPGILGRILLPDGTTNVPVEQAIALVARDAQELAALQSLNIPTPPLPFGPIPSLPSTSLNLTPYENTQRLRPPPIKIPRKPSLYELQTMGYSTRTLATVRTASFPAVSPILEETFTPEPPYTGSLSSDFKLHPITERSIDDGELDVAAIRRKIVANLACSNSRFRTETPKG